MKTHKNTDERRGAFALAAVAVVLLLGTLAASERAAAAAGTEIYKYDSLGRLEQVTFADGTTIKYTYDAAGNRKSSGSAASGPPGTFTKTGGTSPGGTAGPGSITIQNSGSGAIASVVISLVHIGTAGCSGSPASYASLASRQSITYSWYKSSSATFNCTPTATGTNATNSQVQWSM